MNELSSDFEGWTDYPGFEAGFADDILEKYKSEIFQLDSFRAAYPDYFIGSDLQELKPDKQALQELFASSDMTATEFNVATLEFLERLRSKIPDPDEEPIRFRAFYEVAEQKKFEKKVEQGENYDPTERTFEEFVSTIQKLKSVQPLTELPSFNTSLKFYKEYVYHESQPEKNSVWKLTGDSGTVIGKVVGFVKHSSTRGKAIFDPFPRVEVEESIEGDVPGGESLLTPGYFNRGEKLSEGNSEYQIK